MYLKVNNSSRNSKVNQLLSYIINIKIYYMEISQK
jgi:hypothetical protein